MTVKSYLLASVAYWQRFSLKMKVFLISVTLFGVFLAVLPYGIKWGMKQALLKQGLETVQIEDVSFNLFTGRFKVDNMLLKKAGKSPLILGEFFVDFDWPSLFEKRLVIDKLILLNTHLFVEFKPNEFIDVAGIVIPLNKKAAQPETQPSSPLTWKLGLNSLVLKNSVVNLLAPNFDKNIRFDEVALNHLQNWAPDKPADMTFHLAVGSDNSYGGLKGHLKVNAFSETQRASGQVAIDNLLLQAYNKFLPANITKLDAKIDGRFDLAVSNHFGEISAKVNSNLSVENAVFKMQKLQASVGKVGFKGQSDVDVKSGQVSLNNQATLTLGQAELSNDGLKLQIGDLTLAGTRHLTMKNKTLSLESDEALALHQAKVQQQGQRIQLADIDWQGKISTQQSEKQALNLALNGQLKLGGLKASSQGLELEGSGFVWKGKTQVAKAGKAKSPVQIQTKGAVSLSDWQLSNPEQKVNISAFKSLDAEVGFTSPQAFEVKGLTIKHITLAQLTQAKTATEKKPLAKFNRLAISELSAPNTKEFNIGKVTLDGMDVNLVFDENKQIHQLLAVQSALPKSNDKTAKPDGKTVADKTNTTKAAQPSKKSELKWNFGGFDMTGKNHIELLTYATQPAMHKDIRIQHLSVGKVAIAQPKKDTPFKLNATVDKYTKITVTGQAKPLTEKVNLAAKTEIHDMDLYSFSPLIKRDLGYRIQSGALNLNSDVTIKDNILTSKNHVLLIGFDMEADDSGADKKTVGTQLKEQTTGLMSATALKFGLDMLRDSRNNIDLDLPVDGDLSDPNFDASSAINVALRNALTGGTKLALTLALQPYGAIAMVTSMAYDKMNQIQFQPVAFVAGKDALAEGMTAYLDKMGKLLQKKTQISLKVCGYYTAQDVAILTKAIQGDKKPEAPLTEAQQTLLNQQLYDLAKGRQRVVKDWLVEKGKIDSMRLTTCHPSLQKADVTGVSLSM